MHDSARLPRFVERLVRVLNAIMAAVLFAMMALTVVDVCGRYFFNRPVLGSFEITEMMLAALVFCALPLVSLWREHIAVDLFDAVLSRHFAVQRERLIALLSAVCMAFLGWHLGWKAVDAMEFGDATASLLIPLAPLNWLMCVMSALAALILLLQAAGILPVGRARATSPDEGAVSGTSLGSPS